MTYILYTYYKLIACCWVSVPDLQGWLHVMYCIMVHFFELMTCFWVSVLNLQGWIDVLEHLPENPQHHLVHQR